MRILPVRFVVGSVVESTIGSVVRSAIGAVVESAIGSRPCDRTSGVAVADWSLTSGQLPFESS
jgi:hypothetical protein